MANFGYARTSTTEQKAGLEHQKSLLANAGILATLLMVEEASAVKERPVLEMTLARMVEGDSLTVTTLSRLARSTKHLTTISEELKAKGCSLRILDLGIDTSTAQGTMVLTMLSAIAQFERELMLERQKIGVAKAKAEGLYKGRPALAESKVAKIHAMKAKDLKPAEIAKALDIGVSTVYRILKAS